MKGINFWHKVLLKNGEYTPGISNIEYSSKVWYYFHEIDFNNKTVLDIGCWDGYFSFEAERRGAKRVISFDDPKYRWGGMDGFNFLHNHFNSKVEFVKGNACNLVSIFEKQSFDIVLCYGVFYHNSDPLLILKNAFDVCKETIAFEGLMFEDNRRLLELVSVKEINNDSSNFYKLSSGYVNYISDISGFTTEGFKFHLDRGSFICKRTHVPKEFYSQTGFDRS
jgi:tRNA (mo5U34)-methyltransferase